MSRDSSYVPFKQRLGLKVENPISDDFPESARIALIYLLEDLVKRNYIQGTDYGNFLEKYIY